MIVRWLQDCQFECVDWFDEENDEVHTKDIFVNKGEEAELDLVDEHKEHGTVNVQLPKGEMIYGMPTSVYEVIEQDN